MAKEKRLHCAICGGPVTMATRFKLGDSQNVCTDCFMKAGFGMFTDPRKLTLEEVQQRLAAREGDEKA